MHLSLSSKIAFWTLIDPVTGKMVVHLTFKDPGPKKIDYDSLSKKAQKIVDKGLAEGNITTQGNLLDDV
jgi:hypothetical protein